MPTSKTIRSTGREVNSLSGKKGCSFCASGGNPSHLDSATLKRFISDRSRIEGKVRTGLCSRHQRILTREIKHARHLALLPFITKVS